ncbi:MAG: hypothetical protein A2W61_02350 [Deltaproteobacteria bacterium RIFCSPLOWO2_01_44_7]|nr:MAG: hypothetical protein A2712_06600 [Deltaproteobacteria bacterium RIFCSPHIGHO2_01_FULL_43_49]OGQ15623.1 MAG: hypothetical protein A3D22_05390 [Deltaproteobacteria bacterium RIFCSPHIGHO2_02_FULL_44_53]OGQ28592.1 MAG: hypothetical protein A3D98_00125 [Deltaproteobacteria bacterium RIFCSPHIGHO2_12_FULL_44_21]OGQ31914.1 MAG: hypothetical protein A2979_02330 [Deltaproteobacteria bacterium RIFCSPLOWO2_01_FULL_45_74]OGQ37552.1 MAG: hypothetical protein A2W61_02350 [Deltaproteobacteria bacterium 
MGAKKVILFKKLILLGRPASGKSEFIDFMKKLSDARRAEDFHIGAIAELDDFLWLWEKFQEDDLWEKAIGKRWYSKRAEHGYVITDGSILDYCLARFGNEFEKRTQDHKTTTFIEFARGKGDGGYQYALNKLSEDVLKDAAVLFIFTSYEEATRRNGARFQEKLKHSVLAHKVPEEDMIRFGKEIDWPEITNNAPGGYLKVRNFKLPFITMNNEPELKDQEGLSKRYKNALHQLAKLYGEGK